MSKQVKIELNDAGIQELLKSAEMQALLNSKAQSIAAKAGDGYEYKVKVHSKRAAAYIYPESAKAIHDNFENNTLLKVIG